MGDAAPRNFQVRFDFLQGRRPAPLHERRVAVRWIRAQFGTWLRTTEVTCHVIPVFELVASSASARGVRASLGLDVFPVSPRFCRVEENGPPGPFPGRKNGAKVPPGTGNSARHQRASKTGASFLWAGCPHPAWTSRVALRFAGGGHPAHIDRFAALVSSAAERRSHLDVRGVFSDTNVRLDSSLRSE